MVGQWFEPIYDKQSDRAFMAVVTDPENRLRGLIYSADEARAVMAKWRKVGLCWCCCDGADLDG
ncbi:MAG TPA: hypothetical protein P5114_09070 [Hyphomicrobiaceae bacterium]|nr:hypothetical protein [Hyphomicrobiaceae bacterium]